MKRPAILLSLLVAACVVDTTTRTFDPQTGRVLNEQSTRIKVDAVAITTPGTAIKIGDGYARETGRPFDVLDTNSDGIPDVARDNTTGKYYKITGWEPLQQRNTQPRGLPLMALDIYRNDPVQPMNEWPRLDGPTLCARTGFRDITRTGDGTYTLKNVLVYDFFPLANLLNSPTRVGIRQSSDWAFADVQRHPNLRYEILGAAPTGTMDGEHFLVMHLEGTLLDVARYMAENGTQKFWLRSVPGMEICFFNRGDSVEFFINGASAGIAPL